MIQNIVTGWWNFMLKDEGSTALAEKRAAHCASCIHRKHGALTAFINDELKEVQGTYCNKCKCPLSAKLRTPNEQCPLKLWLAEPDTN
jgi:hypothetical protein